MNSDKHADLHLKLRNLESDDYPQVAQLMEEVYADIGGAWSQASLLALIKDFPEGQIAIEDNGNIIAVALTVKCSYDRFSKSHTYDDLIGRRDRIHHDPDGDALAIEHRPDVMGMNPVHREGEDAGLLASLPDEVVCPLADAPDVAPYFSMILLTKGADPWL